MNYLQSMKALYAGAVRPSQRPLKPVYLNFGITTHCNLQCVMCSNPDIKDKKSVSREVFLKVVDEVDPAITVFAGLGEPFLHPDFFFFLEHMASRGVPTSVTTNGVLLSSKIDEVFESGLKMVSVSLDATTPEEYEAIRRRDCFDKVENGLQLLSEGKKSRGISYPYINQHVVVQLKNLHMLEQSVRQAARLGVNMLHFFPVMPIFDSSKIQEVQVDVEFDEFKGALQKAIDLSHSLGIRTNGPYLMRNVESCYALCTGKPYKSNFQTCVDPWLSLYVSEEGLVSPCCKIMCSMFNEKKSVFMGDLKKQSLNEILNSDEYTRFLSRLKKGKTEYSTCHSCITFSIWDYIGNYIERGLLKNK